MSQISLCQVSDWQETIDAVTQNSLLQDLERGQVVYLPKLSFPLAEECHAFLNPTWLAKGSKNISYIPTKQILKGFNDQLTDSAALAALMKEFSEKALGLVLRLFPHYQDKLRIARTSFRPAEIAGRKSSYRKNDMLLHVDAFPSTPMRGERILRVFSNINPNG